MANKRERAIALSAAVLFLLTSVGFSLAVIWQMHQDSQTTKAANAAQAAAANSANQTKGKTLQGTKLANFTPVAKVDQLQIIDPTAGTGAAVKEGDTVTANYTGAVASTGVIFQSSLDSGQPFTAQIAAGQLIDGWVKGIPGMKVGGTRRLLIPAAQAYGANPPQGSGIPANADLVFDIQLISIK